MGFPSFAVLISGAWRRKPKQASLSLPVSAAKRQRAAVVLIIGMAVFGVMAAVATEGQLEEEVAILRWLEDQRSGLATTAMVILTNLGSGVVMISGTILLCSWLLIRERRRDAGFLATANLGSAFVNTVLKVAFERQRPPAEIVSSITDPQTFSFPSGHAMSAAVFYASIAIVGSRLGGAGVRFLLLAAALTMIPAMGFTRLYLGVHYPTDVVAGWALGGAWVSLCYLMFHASGRGMR